MLDSKGVSGRSLLDCLATTVETLHLFTGSTLAQPQRSAEESPPEGWGIPSPRPYSGLPWAWTALASRGTPAGTAGPGPGRQSRPGAPLKRAPAVGGYKDVR